MMLPSIPVPVTNSNCTPLFFANSFANGDANTLYPDCEIVWIGLSLTTGATGYTVYGYGCGF